MMRPVEISIVALFEVPSEPDPYRVGLATSDSLVAITAELSDLAAAVQLAGFISDETGLPIVTRLNRGAVH